MIRRRGEAEVVNANLMTVPVDPTPAVGGYVCLGVISGARGMKGEVRIKSFAEQAENIAAYGPVYDESGERSWRIKVTGQARGQVIARLDGVEDRSGAEALKGLRLHVPREALPMPDDDEYYHADLVGLTAELAGGGVLGTVRAVHDFGAGGILEIAAEGEGEVMVPFTRAIVPEVDMAAGKVIVDPPAGLLEPATDDTDDGGGDAGSED